MVILRHIGSLAFVIGIFCAVFLGLPWYVMAAEDPVLPWWLKTSIFSLLGGILLVLVTVALEQKYKTRPRPQDIATESDQPDLRSPQGEGGSFALCYLLSPIWRLTSAFCPAPSAICKAYHNPTP